MGLLEWAAQRVSGNVLRHAHLLLLNQASGMLHVDTVRQVFPQQLARHSITFYSSMVPSAFELTASIICTQWAKHSWH